MLRIGPMLEMAKIFLGLASMPRSDMMYPTATEDRPDRLLPRGVVHGDVEQVTGGTRLQTTELVDQGLTGCLEEERADDVRANDIRKGVASF